MVGWAFEWLDELLNGWITLRMVGWRFEWLDDLLNGWITFWMVWWRFEWLDDVLNDWMAFSMADNPAECGIPGWLNISGLNLPSHIPWTFKSQLFTYSISPIKIKHHYPSRSPLPSHLLPSFWNQRQTRNLHNSLAYTYASSDTSHPIPPYRPHWCMFLFYSMCFQTVCTPWIYKRV